MFYDDKSFFTIIFMFSPEWFFGSCDMVSDAETTQCCGMYLLGPPRCGKTSLLFQLSMQIAMKSGEATLFICDRAKLYSSPPVLAIPATDIPPAALGNITFKYIDTAMGLRDTLARLTPEMAGGRLPRLIVVDNFTAMFDAARKDNAEMMLRTVAVINNTVQWLRDECGVRDAQFIVCDVHHDLLSVGGNANSHSNSRHMCHMPAHSPVLRSPSISHVAYIEPHRFFRDKSDKTGVPAFLMTFAPWRLYCIDDEARHHHPHAAPSVFTSIDGGSRAHVILGSVFTVSSTAIELLEFLRLERDTGRDGDGSVDVTQELAGGAAPAVFTEPTPAGSGRA